MGRGNTGAIIALVFFVITSGLFGWLFYTQYDRVERLDHPEKGKGLRGQLQDARNLLAGEKKKLEDARTELAARKKALRAEFDRKLRAEVTVNLEEVKQTHALHAKGTAVGIKAKIPGTNEFAISESKKAVGNYHTRKDDSQKRNDTQIQDLTKKRQKLIKDIEDFKNKVATEKDELTGERTHLKNVLSDRERKISELVTREAAGGLPAVGLVMTSDPQHDLAVVNLGTRHGVKPGMRFEVFQIQRGNRRVHKGYLEVKTANPEVSSCTILVKEVRLPRCPICSYTANDVEQKYCPRCTAPGTSQGAQKLNDSPKVALRGKSVTDPIVKGDLIYNPLFSPGRTRRYAISGQPLVKSKAYTKEAIKEAVLFHGNIVDDELSAKTDILIALRGSEEANRAKELGIIVVHGWELFRYLER